MSDEIIEYAISENITTSRNEGPFKKVRDALSLIQDEGKEIDIGLGIDGLDIWITIDGIEYFINMKESLKQIKSESH